MYYICTSSSLFPPSVSLLQAGTEEDVVYPGKLPIVSGGNSLWEGAPRERGSATRGKLTTAASGEASARPPCIRPGSDARGKLAIPWDWRRCGDRGNKREQWRDKTNWEKRGRQWWKAEDKLRNWTVIKIASHRNIKAKDEVITWELDECHVLEIQIQMLGM